MKVFLVTLVEVPSHSPPLGAACIAGVLLKEGYEVENSIEFVEGDIPLVSMVTERQLKARRLGNTASIAERILSFSPDVVGFSCDFSNRYSTADVAGKIRSAAPEVILVAGGPDIHSSCYEHMESNGIAFHKQHMDYLIQGEGEPKIVRLLAALKAHGTFPGDGAIFRCDSMSDTSLMSGYQERVTDLNALPLPDFGTQPRFDRFRSPGGGWGGLPICFSRGCTGNCSFCNRSEYFKRHRFRLGESVYNEMRTQAARYGVDQFLIVDDDPLTTRSISEVEKLCDKLIAAGRPYRWQFLHANFLPPLADRDFALRMSRAGMNGVRFGVDAISPRVRKHMGKMWKIEILDDVLGNFREAGIDTGVHIIYGYPAETEEDFRESLNWIREKSHLTSHLSIFSFVMIDVYEAKRPGTVTYEKPASASVNVPWHSEHVNRQVMWERYGRLVDVLTRHFEGYCMISNPDNTFSEIGTKQHALAK